MKLNLDPFFIFLVFGPFLGVIPFLLILNIDLSISSIAPLSFITYIIGFIPALITANFALNISNYSAIKYICLCTIFGGFSSFGCIFLIGFLGNGLDANFNDWILIAGISGSFASFICSFITKFLSQ